VAIGTEWAYSEVLPCSRGSNASRMPSPTRLFDDPRCKQKPAGLALFPPSSMEQGRTDRSDLKPCVNLT
jgi:hypothetical protein